MSVPLWGCELKFISILQDTLLCLSAPLWGCELKFVVVNE